MVPLFTCWTCDVELDCSSAALPYQLHRMQDMTPDELCISLGTEPAQCPSHSPR